MCTLIICAAAEDRTPAERLARDLEQRFARATLHQITWEPQVATMEWPIESYVLWLASPSALQHYAPTAELLSELDRRRVLFFVGAPPGLELPAALASALRINLAQEPVNTGFIEFLTRELEPCLAASISRSSGSEELGELSRRELRLTAARCLTEAALLDFFWDQHLDPGQLGGLSLQDKLIRFLHYVDRRELTAAFADFLVDEYGDCVSRTLNSLRKKPAWKVGT